MTSDEAPNEEAVKPKMPRWTRKSQKRRNEEKKDEKRKNEENKRRADEDDKALEDEEKRQEDEDEKALEDEDSVECIPIGLAQAPESTRSRRRGSGSAPPLKSSAKRHACPCGQGRDCDSRELGDATMSLEDDGEEDVDIIMGMQASGGSREDASGWRRIEAIVDSGAVRPVIPPDMIPEIPIRPTKESKSGHSFRGAGKNGEAIPNLGEQMVVGVTAEGQKKRMKWTVANVRKALISVGKLEDAGYDVILGRNPRLVHIKSGQVTKLKRRGGVYVLDLWIQIGKAGAQGGSNDKSGFARPK